MRFIVLTPLCRPPPGRQVASPFVVFERDEMSSVAGWAPFDEASETATAGPRCPTELTTASSSRVRSETSDEEHGGRGYRERAWDTRVGTIELAIPKLRAGSYFPRLALAAAPAGGAGVRVGDRRSYLAAVSTRRVEKLVQQLGVERMSKSAVSRPATSLDPIVDDLRTRPLESAPYPFSPSTRARGHVPRGRRTVNACVVHAVAVNRDGFRAVRRCHHGALDLRPARRRDGP